MHGLPAVGKHPPQLHGHAHFDDLTVQAVVNQPIVVQGVSQMAATHPSNNNPKIRNPSPDFLVWNHSFKNPFDDRRHPVSRLIEAEVSGDPVEVVHLGNGIQQKYGLTTLKIKKNIQKMPTLRFNPLTFSSAITCFSVCGENTHLFEL